MSGLFPSSPAFNALNIRSIQPTFISRTISGRRQARQVAGQFFTMTATFPPMTRAQFAPINAFVMKQRGQYESFTVIPPVLSSGLGSPIGTPLVKGASQTGRSIITDGWSPPASGNVLTLSDTTPTATWDTDVTSDDEGYFTQLATSGSGTGFSFTSVTDGSGNPTITVEDGGSGYAVSDTITLRDPSATPTTDPATVTVATIDSAGIKELTDYTPTLSANWGDIYPLDSYFDVAQTSTSGSGTGAKFTIEVTDWEGQPPMANSIAVAVTITDAGSGYAVDDTIVVTDPGSTSSTITLTVKTITSVKKSIFKAGDYLKFANHDKVYTVTDDADSDPSGDSTISIEPALITSPADNSAITHTSVPFTVAFTGGVQEFSTGASGLFSFEVDLEEVI